jgi:signal transduction histidine kinase
MFGPATADRTQMLANVAATALSRAERILSAATTELDDSKYRLISGVGHNLRNTLGAASGYMQLAEMEGPLSGSQKEWIMRSRRAINAAVSLISDVLELNRADAGKLAFEREPVHVEAIAREAVRKHANDAAQKHCNIEFTSKSNAPVIVSDSSHVQNLVDVLVYNAVRYTPREGRVTVAIDTRRGRRSSDATDYICVAVSDTGPGVADEDLVFEEVHRVEQAKGNVRFRLAICRRIARLLGGDITLETTKDLGSTFTLWLPAPAV